MYYIMPLKLVFDQGAMSSELTFEKSEIFLFVSNNNFDNIRNLANFL